jgi:hypothetical protein
MQLESIAIKEKEGKTKLSQIINQIRPERVPKSIFYEILLQRYWLSLSFTPVYDAVLNFLTIEADSAKPILREIIQEEYPLGVNTPSHREDLMTDLVQMGIKHSEIKKAKPTKETVTAIREAFESIITFSHNEKFSDIMLLEFLRYWGEVLTALEYELLWPRIKELLHGKKSVFYEYHIKHDRDTDELDAIAKTHKEGFTHADILGRTLVKTIDTQHKKYHATQDKNAAINSAIQAIKCSTKNKVNFYHQFIQG